MSTCEHRAELPLEERQPLDGIDRVEVALSKNAAQSLRVAKRGTAKQEIGRLVLGAERCGKPGSLDRRNQHFGTDAFRRVDGHARFTRVEIDHDALHAGKEQQ